MRIRSLVAPLAGFVLILLVMNGYQYYKVRQDLAAGIVKEILATEITDLMVFFSNTEDRLLLMKSLCEGESISPENVEALTRKLTPFLNRLEFVSGIVLANKRGDEYYLYPDDGNVVTRFTTMDGETALQKSIRWSSSFEKLKSWQEARQYDPRKRPWFVKEEAMEVVKWTGLYEFFHSGALGITASVPWSKGEEDEDHFVLAVDMTMVKVKAILAARDGGRPGFLFLTKGGGHTFRGDELTSESAESRNRGEVIQLLLQKWEKKGVETGEILRLTKDKVKWVGIFQRINNDKNVFYIGLAATEEELNSWLDSTLLTVDLVDIIFAFFGAALVLLLMWKLGLLHKNDEAQDPPEIRLFSYINKGEGAGVEFKSTVRTNLKTGKTGKEIEIAWLKGVVAFLNSEGGTVLLGVDDSGKIYGIDDDQFENNDRCLLHIKNLFSQHIGAELSPFFSVTLVEVEDKEVVMLECRSAGDAVFLKIGKNEEFYIRSGPSSVKLSPSQIVRYVMKKSGK